MVLYSGVFLSTQTRIAQGEATQFSLIAQGSAVSGLAGFSSFGWIYYIGLEKINVSTATAHTAVPSQPPHPLPNPH